MVQFTVVIPVYNGACFLQRAINSIQKQTLKDFEIIIVDDGSQDSTPDIAMKLARQDSRIRYERLPNNMGVHMARNKGMELARGKFVVFLDADDELFPNALEISAATFKKLDDRVGLVFANGVTPNGSLTGLRIEEDSFVPFKTLLCLEAYHQYKNCFVAIRRDIIGDVRWEAPHLDFIFWRRLQKRTQTFALRRVLMRYNIHENKHSLTKTRRDRKRQVQLSTLTAEALHRFVSEFGHEFQSLCPQAYMSYLRALVISSALAGKRLQALDSLLKMFINYGTVCVHLWLMLAIPTPLLRRLYVKIARK